MKRSWRLSLAVVAVIVIAAGVGLFIWNRSEGTPKVDSFETCVAAGNPILLSYPERCAAPDGKTYANPSQVVQ